MKNISNFASRLNRQYSSDVPGFSGVDRIFKDNQANTQLDEIAKVF